MADEAKNEALDEQKVDTNAVEQAATEESGREDEGRARNGKGKAFFHKGFQLFTDFANLAPIIDVIFLNFEDSRLNVIVHTTLRQRNTTGEQE